MVRWVGTDDVLAGAFDTIIPGYGTPATNTLRLWSAKATEEMDLRAFNQGNYFGAVESKNLSENVSRVLYPDDSTASGRELRLRHGTGWHWFDLHLSVAERSDSGMSVRAALIAACTSRAAASSLRLSSNCSEIPVLPDRKSVV